ncbi:MAG: hypothetical protein SPI56_08130 [Alloprevotella sp.]|nr:hypothetical protein [Alloprevotella sp.]
MRKFTKFFMLLFALVGATEMTAQQTAVYTLTPGERVTEITAGEQYMIYNSCESGEGYCFFLYNNGSAFAGSKSKNPSSFSITGTDAVINKYIFVAEEGTVAGTYAMKNLASSTYPQGDATASESAVNLHFEEWSASSRGKAGVNSYNHDGSTTANASITNENKVWVIYKDGASNNWSSKGSNAPDLWSTAQPFAIYKVTKTATGEVTIPFNFTDTKTGNTFTLANQQLVVGASVSEAVGTHTFYTINSITDQDGTAIETFESTTAALNVSVTSNFPFEVMTITDGAFANANFYTMMIVNGNRDVVYNSDTHIHTVSGTKGFNKESLWAFELIPGTEANFRIYNFSLGADTCIYKNGTNDGPVAMGSTSSSSNTKFTLFKNDTGYGFFIPGTPTACLNASQNQNGEGSNSSLGIWNNNDSPTNNGSRFTFTSVNDMVPETPYSGGYGQDESYTSAEGYVTLSNAAAITALYSYNNNPTSSWLGQAIDNVANADGFDFNDLYNLGTDAAKIYQIIAYGEACKDQPIYANPSQTAEGAAADNNRTLYTGAMAPVDKTAQTAMFLVKEGTNYYIEHANSEYWFSNINDNSFKGTPDLPMEQQYSAPYTIHPAGYMSNVFALKIASADKWLACGGDNNTLTVVTEEPTTASNANGYWLIKEVSKIPVKIGAAKWSTLCLPVAVTVPNDASLKVYTVSGVDNVTGVMTLEEVPARTVVAKNTGLLLASTSENAKDTYNFAVSTEAGRSYNNNILMGTTARRKGFNTNDSADPTAITTPHYALAQKDGVVAFYPSILKILPANKAYIKKADITTTTGEGTSRALYMTGETTGVNNALIQNGEAEEYYDLNGRRVLYPTTGIYATRSGKKVFIK